MKILKVFAFACCLSPLFFCQPAAHADWVWSPEKGKFVNTDEGGQDVAQDAFDDALDLFKEKKLDKAAEAFQLILKKYPKSNVAPEAGYRLGTIYEEQGDLLKAHKAYQTLIKSYPQSERFDEVIEREYQIGLAFLSGKKGKVLGLDIKPSLPSAAEVFKQIVESAPFGPFGDKAQYQLGVTQLKNGKHDEAMTAFQELIDQYPKSEFIQQARLELAEASYQKSKIETRDQGALDAAAKQAERYLQKYPESEEAEKAARIRQEVDEKNAEKNYRIGLYYEKENYLESALIYYRDAAKRYPATNWGQKAADKVKSFEQPVTYLNTKEDEVRGQIERLETQLTNTVDKKKRAELEAEIEPLKKKLKSIEKSKTDSLSRRKQDLKRRERELKEKFKEFERKKKRYKNNTSPEFQKVLERWQASLEAERDAIAEEKDRLANWRAELGVQSEPFYQNMLSFMDGATPIEQVRELGEKDLYKLSKQKKELLEKKEKLYKRYRELQTGLAPQVSEQGLEIKRLRGAERKRIAEKPPEQLTPREKEIQQTEKQLDEKLALYEKHFGKMAEKELENIMARKAVQPVRAGIPPAVGGGDLSGKSLSDLLALKMHLEEKVAAQQTIVDTLSSAFNRELALQQQKEMMKSLEERKETDLRLLRKQIKAAEKDIRARYQDIEDRNVKKQKLVKELKKELEGEPKHKTLKAAAQPVTGTLYLTRAFLFGLPNEDEELNKEAKKKGGVGVAELQQEIELESLMIEAQNVEIARKEKELEILQAKASLAGGYKVRSAFVKVPHIFIDEAVESARRIVPRKDRKEVLLNRLNGQSQELEAVKARLLETEKAIEAKTPRPAATPVTPGPKEQGQSKQLKEGPEAEKAQETPPDEKELRETVMRLFEKLEVSYSIYTEEQGILDEDYREKLEKEMRGPGLDKEKAKQFKELKTTEAELAEVVGKELKIEDSERAILDKRMKEADKLLPQVKSKAMTQDLMTEKTRIQARLKDLDLRRDFLTKEKERFSRQAS